MNPKKHLLKLAFLAVTPALLAADPAAPAPASMPAADNLLSGDLADEAGLVQQIGAEASRGFDVEAHARALRAQMEALVSGATASGNVNTNLDAAVPPPVKAAAATPVVRVTQPVANKPSASPAPQDGAVQEAIRKMRAALDDLESQLHR